MGTSRMARGDVVRFVQYTVDDTVETAVVERDIQIWFVLELAQPCRPCARSCTACSERLYITRKWYGDAKKYTALLLPSFPPVQARESPTGLQSRVLPPHEAGPERAVELRGPNWVAELL